MQYLLSFLKGGKGSGNFGHSGRPGERGGSGGGGGPSRAVKGEIKRLASKRDKLERQRDKLGRDHDNLLDLEDKHLGEEDHAERKLGAFKEDLAEHKGKYKFDSFSERPAGWAAKKQKLLSSIKEWEGKMKDAKAAVRLVRNKTKDISAKYNALDRVVDRMDNKIFNLEDKFS